MALKEDYKDAVFAGLRKYKMLDNGDGTVSPVDMTEYETAGDKFGAKDVNAITKMVNCTGDAFDPGRDYEVGDYTIYDNTVWKFTTAHPAGMWDESHVEKTRILAEIAEQNKNFASKIKLSDGGYIGVRPFWADNIIYIDLMKDSKNGAIVGLSQTGLIYFKVQNGVQTRVWDK